MKGLTFLMCLYAWFRQTLWFLIKCINTQHTLLLTPAMQCTKTLPFTFSTCVKKAPAAWKSLEMSYRGSSIALIFKYVKLSGKKFLSCLHVFKTCVIPYFKSISLLFASSLPPSAMLFVTRLSPLNFSFHLTLCTPLLENVPSFTCGPGLFCIAPLAFFTLSASSPPPLGLTLIVLIPMFIAAFFPLVGVVLLLLTPPPPPPSCCFCFLLCASFPLLSNLFIAIAKFPAFFQLRLALALDSSSLFFPPQPPPLPPLPPCEPNTLLLLALLSIFLVQLPPFLRKCVLPLLIASPVRFFSKKEADVGVRA
mmetsp:Transcript_20994/g.43804  ORF Transcript_20994/g.43804 Transcript_20994/m.43804 type:complete len:308 (-) Transcript_20994:166-1089(-)